MASADRKNIDMFAAKHMDFVVGVDIHINLVGAPPVPTPTPHPYSGMILDVFDYLPAPFGQTIKVNGLLAAQPMTEIADLPIQFPMLGPFPMPPKSKGEVFTGSATVGSAAMSFSDMGYLAQAAAAWAAGTPPPPPPPPAPITQVFPLSRLTDIALGCADIGSPAPSISDPNAKGGVKGLSVPMGIVMAVPLGFPVMVMGPPMIAPLTAWVMRGAFMGLMKLGTKLGKKALTLFNKGLKRAAGEGNAVSKRLCSWGFEPIDLATGKVVTEREDFSLPGPIPFNWECTYYSNSQYDGPIGYGWHHSYDLSLCPQTFEGKTFVKLRMADGRVTFFRQLKIGESDYDREDKVELFRDVDGYFVRDANRLLYRFHEEGENWPLASVGDTSGNIIRFEYDSYYKVLNRIVDSSGRELEVHTDVHGKILSVNVPHPEENDQDFPIVRYKYDDNGNLLFAANALDHRVSYSYKNHLMIQLTYRDGLSFYYEYDAEDHRARCVHTYGDGNLYKGNLVYEKGKTTIERIVERENAQIESFFETYYHDGAVVLKELDALGNEKRYKYSADYELLEEVDQLGNKRAYEYDKRGNISKIIHPDGSSLQISYTEAGLIKSYTNQIGVKKQFFYDKKERIAKITDNDSTTYQYSYNERGLLSLMVDPNGGRTLIGYDKQGNIIQITSPDNASSRWKYDNLGRNLESIDPVGSVQFREFDLLGRGTLVKDPDGNRKEIAYDEENNVTRIKTSDRDIHFEYTGLGNLKAQIEKGNRIEFHYDTEGNLLKIYNEEGRNYDFKLNANGEPIEEIGFDGIKHRYKRDPKGQITSVQRFSEIKTRYSYDPMGRITQIKHSNGEEENFVYREDGELLEANNLDTTVQFQRDIWGNVLSEIQNGFEVCSKYDSLGNRTHLSTSLGLNLDISRNLMGDALEIQTQVFDRDWKIQFKRNVLGLEIERNVPGGLKEEWLRDNIGRPIKHKVLKEEDTVIQRSREYDWGANNRLKKYIDFGQTVTKLLYDDMGNLTKKVDSQGIYENRISDKTGNLYNSLEKTDRTYGSGGQLLNANGTQYFYDREGNLVKRITNEKEIWNYEWSASGELVKVVRPDKKEVAFAYDAMGRRVSKTFNDTKTCWIWNGNFPVHEFTINLLNENVSVNLANEKSLNNDFENNEINLEERLFPSSFLGKSQGIEIRKKAIFKDTVPSSFANQAVLSPNQENLITWIFDPDSFRPIGKIQNDVFFSIQSDHLGTPFSMYDEKGNQVWSAEFDTNGSIKYLYGKAEDCPFRFPGQYEDVETGLFYNRFRYYDPEVGAYISQDPVRLSGGVNFYKYVKNPTFWTDPFGLAAVCSKTIGDAGEDKIYELLRREFKKKDGFEIAQQVWGKFKNHPGTTIFDFVVYKKKGNKVEIVCVVESKSNSSTLTDRQIQFFVSGQKVKLVGSSAKNTGLSGEEFTKADLQEGAWQGHTQVDQNTGKVVNNSISWTQY